MIPLLIGCLVPACAPVAPVVPEPPVLSAVQDPDDEEQGEIADKREDIKQYLADFAGHIKKRGKEDEEAIAIIDKLFQEFPGCGPKDRKSIANALATSFKQKRLELDPGVPDNRLYMASAIALREMAPESVDLLIKWIDDKKHRKNLALRARLIDSLGKTEDPRGSKPLMDLLRYKDAELQAAAAQALGNYREAPLKERKKMFEALLKAIMSQKGQMDSDPQNLEARDRYYAIAAPIISSLQALSGHDERDPDMWRRWWNNNKKKDWDEDDE